MAWTHGKTVVDGVLRFTSVSALKRADPDSEQGCPRAWWYQYILGNKEPPSEAMARGIALHEEVERYYATGVRSFSPTVLRGFHLLPPPGPDLRIEHPMAEDLATAPLRAAGIPVVGKIDLTHARGLSYGGADIEDTRDPPGTHEVLDWKFPNATRYVKRPGELALDLQMAGYGKWIFETEPEARLVRLSHGVMPQRGNPLKVTARTDREAVERTWRHADKIARDLIDIAKEPNPDVVPANVDACFSFGRECIHKRYCKAGMSQGLAGFFSAKEPMTTPTTPASAPRSALLDKLKKGAAVTAPAATLPAPADVAKRALELAKAEAEKRCPGLLGIYQELADLGIGLPQFQDAAARDVCAVRDIKFEGDGLAGSGDLSECIVSDTTKMPEVLAEAREYAASMTAPAVEPDLGAGATIVPPDAPAPSMPVAAPVGLAAEPAAPEKKRGPKKAAPTTTVTNVVVVDAASATVASTADTTINIFVDCDPSIETIDLWIPLRHTVKLMNAHSGEQDFRHSKSAQYDFGKWRATLAIGLAEQLTPGNYRLSGAAGEIAVAAAEALRAIAEKSGGLYVQGTR